MTAFRLLGILAALAVVALLLAVPFLLRNAGIYLVALWAVTTIAALGLNLTLGYAGQISLAQGAFVGLGAYATALLTGAGVPFFVAFLASGILAFAVGWCLGYPALRVQHHFLAFVTLAFAVLVYLVLRNEEWLTNGTYGINDIARPVVFGFKTDRNGAFYYFTLAMLAVFAGANWWIVHSPWGRAFKALRENPLRAASLGVDVRRYTLMAFAIGSAYGGFAGALYAPLVQFIEPNSFQLAYSIKYLLMVIVGGAGSFVGPFLGAAVELLLPDWLRVTGGYYLILYAFLVMVMLAFFPKGLVGVAEALRSRLVRRPAAPTGQPPRAPAPMTPTAP